VSDAQATFWSPTLSPRPIMVAVHQDHLEALPEAWLADIADRALSALALPGDSGVEVVVTDDETVRELNLRHRGLDETTDVLSFAPNIASTGPANRPVNGSKGDNGDGGFVLPPGSDEDSSIGEVIISGPVSARQAASNARETSEEVAFLLAHGILHLMGHDHEEPQERTDMEAEHRRLLIAMLGPTASSIPVEYPS
jgi:probable rRNA maturation factor